MMKFKHFLFLLIGMALIVSCSANQESDEGKLVVFTSIVPQQYFVDRIGGDYVEVTAMVLPGESPATYEPKPSQMTSLSNAEVYFSIGVPFENTWLEKIADANSSMLIIDSAAGIERRVMTEPHTHEGEEHEEEDHDEEAGELDPHVWLSPELVKIQAENIHAALVELDPDHAEVYDQNLASFIEEIETLESDITTTLSGITSSKFMVFHPSWGYFADQFDLEMIAIEVGGTEPSAAELAALITEAEEEGIHVVFAQPEFSTQDAQTIATAIDGEVIMIDPLAYDWLENMREVANTFADVLK